MGNAAADVQREIAYLRKETDQMVVELESRAKDVTDVRAQVRRHPAVAAGAGLALLGGLAFAGYAVFGRVQEARKPRARLDWPKGDVKETLGERVKELGRNPGMRTRERGNEDMLKRVLYAGLTAAAMALATYLARRTVETLWSKTMQEKPPAEHF